MKKILAVIISLAALVVFAKQEQKPAVFKAGDNVCFVGDSITHGGFYIENATLFYVTRFPDQKINFYNFGISGDSCGGILSRMEDDVSQVKADIYTLMIGMNDVGRGKYSEEGKKKPDFKKSVEKTRERYAKQLEKIVDKLSSSSRKLIIFTPSIYDQTSDGKTQNLNGVNDELKVFGKIGAKLAKKYGASTVDMHSYMAELNDKIHKTDTKKSVIGGDRVHPRDAGGFVMASKFVIDLGEPKFVSETVLDAAKKTAEKTFNADISALKFGADKISFGLFEAALPYPTTKEKDAMDAMTGFLGEYNREILRIKNLTDGEYTLSIDGKKVGEFSAEQFAKGVNLAKIKITPQYKQAEETAKLCKKFRAALGKHRDVRATEYFLGLRKFKSDEEKIAKCKAIVESEGKPKNPYILNLAKAYPKNKPVQKQLMQDAQKVLEQAYRSAQPQIRKFEISKM